MSIADRRPCDRLVDILADIQAEIVRPLQERYPEAKLPTDWSLLVSAALEVLGQQEAMAALESELPAGVSGQRLFPVEVDAFVAAAYRFVSSVRRRGFLPGRIRLAARRYRSWAQLNPGATLEARAATLDQIESAYGLDELEAERPGSRLQLFRHTVFRASRDDVTGGLDRLIASLLSGDDPPGGWRAGVAGLREAHDLSADEEFFLARMLYPHVDPRARAVLTREEDLPGALAVGIEVEVHDAAGDVVRIRRPVNPNETNALYRIFRASNFRQLPAGGDHDLLVATDARSSAFPFFFFFL